MIPSIPTRYLPWILGLLGLFLGSATWAAFQFGGDIVRWVAGFQEQLVSGVDARPALAGVIYVLVVTFGKVTPFPGGFLLMLSGGFLFGAPVGAVLSALGSASSAVMVGGIGRWLFFDAIHRRWGSHLARFQDTVATNGFNFILAARLFPIVPAWIINLMPVVFPIPFRHVWMATFLGLIPLSFVVASLGEGLSNLAQVEDLSPSDVFRPSLLLPLAGLALLALAPSAVRLWRQRRRARGMD
ncbi:VTT domain-containing protein [Ectothiorhodospira haloalkaliphila]|uniref:TVP38/TMEM64 family protein n=1 Tax=Ectothiorhodospira haloalkaliphila TaxID=421628 RepID=UPI001EE90AEB|nr:VTT domain-containing protein [Ectothiorhodospira haloalkaliphila]MCG5524896.1 VTT domain-containing protein [Ectothiorhodospira haloalkaliphila]